MKPLQALCRGLVFTAFTPKPGGPCHTQTPLEVALTQTEASPFRPNLITEGSAGQVNLVPQELHDPGHQGDERAAPPRLPSADSLGMNVEAPRKVTPVDSPIDPSLPDMLSDRDWVTWITYW